MSEAYVRGHMSGAIPATITPQGNLKGAERGGGEKNFIIILLLISLSLSHTVNL